MTTTSRPPSGTARTLLLICPLSTPDRHFCLLARRRLVLPHEFSKLRFASRDHTRAAAVMPTEATMIGLDSMRVPSEYDSLLPADAKTATTSSAQNEMANRRAFSRGFAARRRRTAIVSPCGAGLRDHTQ